MDSAPAIFVVALVVAPTGVVATTAPGGAADGVGPAGRPLAEGTWDGTVSAATEDGTVAPASAEDALAPERDDTVTRIAVRPNGDARWTVRIRTRLSTDGEYEGYLAFQRQFRNDTASYRDPFAERIRGVVADAATATGREMTVRNVTASTSIQEIPRRWGVVAFSFTWTNFARQDGDALVVGDAFEGGLLLARNDTLVVAAPPGYVIPEGGVDPAPDERDDGAVTWTGPEEFADGRPRVRMVPATPTPSKTGPNSSGGGGPGLMYGLVVVVALLAGGVALYRRGGSPVETGEGGGDGGRGESAGPGGAEESPPVLTDAERVEGLLDGAGGRMKQADVAEELDWSASKTSRVVSRLVEEGRVEKFRVGRENVLDLVEDD